MAHIWQLQEAKNRFSELVDEALEHGPQIITRRGKETAVLISFEEFHKLTCQEESIVDFFRKSPLVGLDIDLSRDKMPIGPVLEL